MSHFFGQRTYYYRLDPELRMIHVFRDCRGLKVAIKYDYMKEFKLKDGDSVSALRLDSLVTKEGYRVCHSCWAREQGLAKKNNQSPRPGFKKEPKR